MNDAIYDLMFDFGFLKLFYEKCMCVCMFVYLFVFPQPHEQIINW